MGGDVCVLSLESLAEPEDPPAPPADSPSSLHYYSLPLPKHSSASGKAQLLDLYVLQLKMQCQEIFTFFLLLNVTHFGF